MLTYILIQICSGLTGEHLQACQKASLAALKSSDLPAIERSLARQMEGAAVAGLGRTGAGVLAGSISIASRRRVVISTKELPLIHKASLDLSPDAGLIKAEWRF
jgi:hypothetical protein